MATLATIDDLIKPGSQNAVLVLSNGEVITLDQATTFSGKDEGDAKIDNNNSKLSYSTEEKQGDARKMVYNELKTPKGGGYNLNLEDGTEVWLNAGSSIKFPVSFNDSTRTVFLEGEAYFDVTHNGKPFIVNTDNLDVRVLGTEFNVSAYLDEDQIKTTLVNGSVIIEVADKGSGRIKKLLVPNEQAVLVKSTSMVSVATVNPDHYTSWMRGMMEFNNEPLDVVMRRLARWYDFKYEFRSDKVKARHFTANIENKENISTVLEMLEMTTNVEFELEENVIVVK